MLGEGGGGLRTLGCFVEACLWTMCGMWGSRYGGDKNSGRVWGWRRWGGQACFRKGGGRGGEGEGGLRSKGLYTKDGPKRFSVYKL